MFRFIEFWKRNSTFIITILVFLFFMDYCGRIIFPGSRSRTTEHEIERTLDYSPNALSKGLKSYDEIIMERNAGKKTNWPLLSWLTAATIVGFAGYFAHRKGWLKELIPGRVSFDATLLKDKMSGRLLMRLILSNTTTESQTFLGPQLLFKKLSEARRFKIKSDDFPITLTSGTSHSLIIDIDQFYEKVADLEAFKRIGAEIDTTGGKVFRTMVVPRWWVFRNR